ncbi:MAG: protein kinase [Microcoleaceae cyanobacterium]
MVTSQLLDRRYQVLETLESTDIGSTYLAKDTHRPGETLCFVKHLHLAAEEPEFIEIVRRRFRQEAQILEKLSEHDQIPRLLAYFEENKEFYLVETYVKGRSLLQEIQAGHPLLEEQVVQILIEVLEILIFVHGHGVIHRDIKPSNLSRRDSDDKLVLLDFGAVKELSLYPNDNPRTARVGTIEYMPVEQFDGHPQFNSDIYALGMIGIQALTGLPIYELRRLREANQMNGNKDIAWRHLAIVKPELADILDKMVRYDYQERYQSSGEVLAELRRLSGQPQTTSAKIEAYRNEVQNCANQRGDISVVGRKILDEMRLSLELSPEDAESIEDEILNPYRKYQQKGRRYEQALTAAVQQEYPFTPETVEELERLQQILGISDDDVTAIEQRILPQSFWNRLVEFLSFGRATRLKARRVKPRKLTESTAATTSSILEPTTEPLEELEQHIPVPNALVPNMEPGVRPIESWQHSPAVNQTFPSTAPSTTPRTSANPWVLFAAGVAALVAFALAMTEYQRRQEVQAARIQQQQLDQQQIERIQSIAGGRNYELCVNEAAKISDSSTQFVAAQEILQQCQDGANWRSATVQDLAQLDSAVNAVTFHPRGQLLASGSQAGLVKLWKTQESEPIETLEGDASPIHTVDFSPDGLELASGSDHWRILEWNLVNQELFAPLEHAGPIWSVAVSPDERTVASGSSDATVKVWDRQSGFALFDFPAHQDVVYAVAFTPNGVNVVSGSADQTIQVMSLETGEFLNTLEGHTDVVRSVAISPDGQTIVSGSFDETVKVWDLETGELLNTLGGHSGAVLSVAVSPDGRLVASGSADRTVKIWDLETGELLNTLTGHTDEVNTVAFSPDSKQLVTGGQDRLIKLWKQ